MPVEEMSDRELRDCVEKANSVLVEIERDDPADEQGHRRVDHGDQCAREEQHDDQEAGLTRIVPVEREQAGRRRRLGRLRGRIEPAFEKTKQTHGLNS